MSSETSVYECPICCLFMTPPGRNPMTLNCGHTFCEQCLGSLRNAQCPVCKTAITSKAKSFLLCDIIANYLETHEVDPEANPPSGAPQALCTFAKHGRSYITQRLYQCATCNLMGDLCCCEACAKTCHKGHDCTFMAECSGYCDCGAGDSLRPCCCLGKAATRERCTFSYLREEYIGQRFYNCLTCGLTDGMGCCEICARVCHVGHDIRLVPRSNPPSRQHSSFCDCGASGACQCCELIAPAQCLRDMAPILFRCDDCRKSCCGYCALHCHRGHHLIFEGVRDDHSCRCTCRRPRGPLHRLDEEIPPQPRPPRPSRPPRRPRLMS